MPDRLPTTWGALSKGDYVEDLGEVWKVTHFVEREDGPWFGLTNARGEQKKVSPQMMGFKVTRLVYGAVATEEQAVDNVLAAFPGSQVTHPSERTLDHDGDLYAHLARFHGFRWESATGLEPTPEALLITHRQAHAADPDIHTHQED